ncbi:MAG: hypothetical protein O2971_13465 [Proteobacteria bacterium]|nr:hypothetical protein [Pseudomonadota bacterium]
MPSTVTVYYPFHPLYHHCLKVLQWPRPTGNTATVARPDGKALKIPLWMLDVNAKQYQLSQQATLPAEALNALVDLLQSSTVTTTQQQEQPHAADYPGTRQRRGRRSPAGDESTTGATIGRRHGRGYPHPMAKRRRRNS